MKLDRKYITPFISVVFLAVGVSGILMFFHLFDGYTEVVHECLGLFFVVCAVFHIILNWKALKIHFKKGVFIPSLLGVLTISVTLIIVEIMNPPVDITIINKVIKAPINDAFKALDVDYSAASGRLKANGISIEKAMTIEDIWINNNADPEKVIDLITE
ncbi:DUF4405 domain-containing protein [Chitinophaga cymbidii]|nr:DUF4405 domain-containing protein [Chitinophaga cymbidii]